MVKKAIKAVLTFIITGVASLFFERRYLKSIYFTGTIGWKWIWRSIFFQKILRINSNIPFPVSHNMSLSTHRNLEFDIDDINNFQMNGCYFQNFKGKIVIGKGTYIAPNVGIITVNHDLANLDGHGKGADVVLGKKCWIGMNSVIMPGVTLGDNTTVGAGSIVTKSFVDGNVIIAGTPAKVIREGLQN